MLNAGGKEECPVFQPIKRALVQQGAHRKAPPFSVFKLKEQTMVGVGNNTDNIKKHKQPTVKERFEMALRL